MILDLKTLFDLVGESREVACDLDLSNESLYGIAPFGRPVRVAGKIENRAGVVKLVFSVKSVLSLQCDRCLKVVERDLDDSFEHILVRELSNEEDEDIYDYVICEDGTLDLAELVRTDLMLELPTKVLCKEDCKGLCPKCGKDLNLDSCNCKTKDIDPRWQALSDLFS